MQTETAASHPTDRLALFYHLAHTFNSTLDLDQVFNRVIGEVIVATRAERGFVMLKEPDGKLSFRVARGIDQQTIDEPAFQVSRSICEKVAADGQPIIAYHAQTDTRFTLRQSVMFLGLRSALCVPLVIKENILGVVYADNRLQAGIFSTSDQELLSAIASNAAFAIENARLYQLAVEKGRLEKELQMAREVQISLLPGEIPQFPSWEIMARWKPARQVAGDYYDFILDENGQLGVIIADVSDHGMPASLFMALTRSASLDQTRLPVAGIERANRLISSDAAKSMFITLFYLLIEPLSGKINYVNAGHNPPLHFDCASQTTSQKPAMLGRTGMALGIMPDTAFEERIIELASGDFIFLYSDGVIDALNDQDDPFGIERMLAIIKDKCHKPAWQTLAALEEALTTFTGTSEPFDDITLLIVKRL